jgi:hypothetical protein
VSFESSTGVPARADTETMFCKEPSENMCSIADFAGTPVARCVAVGDFCRDDMCSETQSCVGPSELEKMTGCKPEDSVKRSFREVFLLWLFVAVCGCLLILWFVAVAS